MAALRKVVIRESDMTKTNCVLIRSSGGTSKRDYLLGRVRQRGLVLIRSSGGTSKREILLWEYYYDAVLIRSSGGTSKRKDNPPIQVPPHLCFNPL